MGDIMDICQIDQTNRADIDAFLIRQWFCLQMVVHGESFDLSMADGWYALEDNEIVGLITYQLIDKAMEILSLDSLLENQGIGTALLGQAVKHAKDIGIKRIILTTTNDNLSALRFYQKRGFDIFKINLNAVEQSRKIKPEIPLISMDGIPIKHEIELELIV